VLRKRAGIVSGFFLGLGLSVLGGRAFAQQIIVRNVDATSRPPFITVRADPVGEDGTLARGLKAEDFKLTFYTKPSDEQAFKLKPKDKDPLLVIASSVTSVQSSPVDTAMLILIEGARIFVGDSEYQQPDPATGDQPRQGALRYAKAAAIQVADAVKQGEVGVSFYAANYIEKISFGPPQGVKDIEAIKQEEFKNERNRGFFAAVDTAITSLINNSKKRKILVIISDGVEGAQGEGLKVDPLVEKARTGGVEIYALQYQDNEDPMADRANMKALGRELGLFKTTRNAAQLETFAKLVKDQIEGQYRLEFEAPDAPWAKSKSKPDLRGIKIKAKDFEGRTEAMFGYFRKPKKGAVWPWIVFPGVGLLLIIVIVLIAKRKGSPEPMPMPMPMPVPAAPAPAAAPSPQKTMMLGFGGGGDDMPMVGWIVAVAGPQAGQTFKLQQGRTTVGTAQESNIVVMDPFMSTRHAEILQTPVGFQLIDVGSTNGSFVNSKRIKSHELVDNDAFTLGKTDFKFKSIN